MPPAAGPARPRILVMGAGGIGGITAAGLLAAGHDVTTVSTNPAIRAAIEAAGFVVSAGGQRRVARGPIHAAPPPDGRYDLVILATQPPQVEEAAATAAPHLTADGAMVVLQNGLCEERVARIVGPDHVLGAIVAWGASMTAPGCYDRTAEGGFTVGHPGGAESARLRQLAEVLGAVAPTKITDNLRGARWSKLALNAAISSLGTIAGERLGPLVRVARYRRLALAIMTEVVDVAHHHQVRLEKVAGTLDLEWVALTPRERAGGMTPALVGKHLLLSLVGARYRRMRSSMLSAIERGRTPAIDFLGGEVVSRGAAAGVPTPVNAAVVEAVWRIARGQARSSRALLDQLCADSASAAGTPGRAVGPAAG